MDIIDFWQKQVDKWNEDKKCGFCWDFAAPLLESQSNIKQLREDKKCCVQVFITDLQQEHALSYRGTDGILYTNEYCEYSYNLFFLYPSELGINNYNEITGYPIEQSKWNTIFKPLQDCLGCESILNFCEIIGFYVQITRWRMSTVHNYLDMNFDGWKINVTFRKYT